MLASLLLCLAGAFAPDQCDDCTQKKLCKPHAAHVTAELERLEPDLESEDQRTRMSALEDVADLSDAHENAPSKQAAEVLAAALADERLVVREKAIELLTEGQHPETAVTATVELLKSYQRSMWTLVETLMGRDGKAGTTAEAMRLVKTSLESAGRLRDDRVVKAVESVLKAFPTEMRGQPAAQAAVEVLLEFRTQSAVTTVISQFSGLRDADRAATIQSSLEDMALDLEFDDAPEVEKDWKKAWTGWFRRHRKAFPTSLGKWTGEPLD